MARRILLPLLLAAQALADAASDVIFAEMQASQLNFEALAVAYARIDPIVSPGPNVTSGHGHMIVGPNNVRSDSTGDQLRQGSCTTIEVGGAAFDMSAYWTPFPYHVSADGSLTTLDVKTMTVYYNMGSGAPMTAFPPNFQMITGNASFIDPQCGQNGKQPDNAYFYFNGTNSPTLPPTWQPSLGIHLSFPDCWDGTVFTKATQSQHMGRSAWAHGFPCPAAFPIKLPQIMLSFSFNTGTAQSLPTNPNGPTYVMSNGDPFGCSLHGDFMNGWQANVLEQVIAKCSNLGLNNKANCPALQISSASNNLAKQCRYTELVPQEDIGLEQPIKQLPGCLNLQGGKIAGCSPSVPFGKPSGFDATGGWPFVVAPAPSPSPAATTMATVVKSSPTPAAKTTTTSPSKSPTSAPVAAPAAPTNGGTAYICSVPNWVPSSKCTNFNWVTNACNSLQNTPYDANVQSFGPNLGSCTLYSDYSCNSPISGDTAITNPGLGSMGSAAWQVRSYDCKAPSSVAASAGSGTVYLCSDTTPGHTWSDCQNWTWKSYQCLPLTGTMFQDSLASFGPNRGSCTVYRDGNCRTPMAKYLSVKNPGIATFEFAQYAGSIMCI